MPDRAVQKLELEARYRRERLALYRARIYSDRPTTAVRLRELERLSHQAEQRLRTARSRSPGPTLTSTSTGEEHDG
jgi:hypothetical protein